MLKVPFWSGHRVDWTVSDGILERLVVDLGPHEPPKDKEKKLV